MTGILEYVIHLAGDADPLQKGFQAQPGYIFFNIVVPILLGGLLSRITGPIEWFVGRLIGKTG